MYNKNFAFIKMCLTYHLELILFEILYIINNLFCFSIFYLYILYFFMFYLYERVETHKI